VYWNLIESAWPFSLETLQSLFQQVFSRQNLELQLDSLGNAFWHARTALFYRWQFRSVGPAAAIRRPVKLSGKRFISIGAGVNIMDGVRIEVLPGGSKRKPRIVIGAGTKIEEFVRILCRGRVLIGSNVTINGRCAILDTTEYVEGFTARPVPFEEAPADYSFVEIGDDTLIGFGAMIAPNVRIGRHCIIGANSVVTQDVPDYTIAAGSPARLLRRYDADLRCWLPVESEMPRMVRAA
jgi:acetyltransferase-like isoleucine patch superfamily enzyme